MIYESIVKKDKETASHMAKVHIDNQKKAIIRPVSYTHLPYTTVKVVEGIEDYMRTYHVENLTDLIGAVE